MSRITITLHIDIPDGAKVQTPDVDYRDTAPQFQPPLPDAPPPDLFQEAARIFPESEVTPSQAPVCRIHNKPMTYFPAGPTKTGPNAGKPRGAFYKCSEKVGDAWCQQRQNAA